MALHCGDSSYSPANDREGVLMKKDTSRPVFTVVLRRSNGRFVQEARRPSRYAAKRLAKFWEERYDSEYYVEIREDSR